MSIIDFRAKMLYNIRGDVVNIFHKETQNEPHYREKIFKMVSQDWIQHNGGLIQIWEKQLSRMTHR